MTQEEITVNFVKDTDTVVRQQALGKATTQISYQSTGYCLIVGDLTEVLVHHDALAENGYCVVTINADVERTSKQLTDSGIAVFTVPELTISGHLGAYQATVPGDTVVGREPQNLGVSVYRESGYFDVVLDLSEKPMIPNYLPPFGYFHARGDTSIKEAVEQITELAGEFEKPRYFEYNAATCAHSRSELPGCQRCMEACATGAITSSGEGILVDPYLCQGCGSCATVCPSGAMTYAYPRPKDAIDRTRHNLSTASADIIVLYSENDQAVVEAISLPSNALPLLVEEVSAFGPDYWLTMLAGTANSIIIVADFASADPNRLAIESQLLWVEPLLNALGVINLPVELVAAEQVAPLVTKINKQLADSQESSSSSYSLLQSLSPADFATHGDKRQTIRLALDALHDQMQPADAVIPLPNGAPFGRINVDKEACTLCMACVSTCPAKALLDGQDTPALRFVEANCLQCGLCETACPESAISLSAQYTWDSISARKIETLHEEKPFHCLQCHTPFTTQAMIENMTEKLSGHWMFQDEKAKRRLKLCGDCRVRDMFESDESGIEVHRS